MTFSLSLIVAAAAGVATHLGIFIRGEHHLQAPTIASTCLFLASLLCIFQLVNGVPRPVGTTLSLICAYCAALFASVTVYRIAFHRLRSFPGPFLAKATKLWHVGNTLHADNYLFIEKLHREYGDFVRTGPNELSITKSEALHALHSFGTKCSKSYFHDVLHPAVALNSTRDRKAHDERRKLWSPNFSPKAIDEYEVRYTQYAQQLSCKIADAAGKPVNASALIKYFAFDAMGEIAFGESFDMLDTGGSHPAVNLIQDGMAIIGPLTPMPWLLIICVRIPGLSRNWKQMVQWCANRVQRSIESDRTVPSIMSALIDASLERNSLEKDRLWLNGDSLLATIAGSGTVAVALTFALYHVAVEPRHQTILRDEIASFGPAPQAVDLLTLHHLNGVINEALRLHPPDLSGLLRQTPPEGITIAGRYIPGDTTVCVPSYTVSRLECYFTKGDQFIPERWYSQPELVKDKSAFSPFSGGRYSCIGKNLAMRELATVIALLVTKYDISLAPGEDGHDLLYKTKDTFTAQPARLDLVFAPRL